MTAEIKDGTMTISNVTSKTMAAIDYALSEYVYHNPEDEEICRQINMFMDCVRRTTEKARIY